MSVRQNKFKKKQKKQKKNNLKKKKKLLRHLGSTILSLLFAQAQLAACQTAFLSERLGYCTKVFKQPCFYLFL